MTIASEKHTISKYTVILTLITAAALSLSLVYYTNGLLHSPLCKPYLKIEQVMLQKYNTKKGVDKREEKVLAQDYWLRYEDIKKDNYWGENGPMGIFGPRDHFQQHGKREGRIFQPVFRPQDMVQETRLAQAYWRRYPEIKDHAIWGINSSMGILGPRDHHRFRGRHEGKIWTISPANDSQQ